MKNRLITRTLLAASAISLLVGCGKERPLKQEPRVNHDLKSLISETDSYFYLVGTGAVDMTTAMTRPHFMGQAKVGKFRFTNNSLDFIQIPRDKRHSENPANVKPILQIPAEYKSYKCSENGFGECTGKEEEDKYKDWQNKPYVLLDYDKLKDQEINFLPLQLAAGAKICLEETDQQVIEYNLDKDQLQIEVEKSFRLNIMCALNSSALTINEFFEALSFKVRYQYSMVKLDKLIDPKYKSVEYPVDDESAYGFFNTEWTELDPDNGNTVGSKKVVLNRWNPDRKQIVYYLSPNFNKAANLGVKAVTKKMAQAVTNGFHKAGVDLEVVIKDAPEGMNMHDITKSVIILEEDPLASGVIGYGPTAANPYTGEILHGRVIMYLGTMKKFIKRTWDSLVASSQAKTKATSKPKSSVTKNEQVGPAEKTSANFQVISEQLQETTRAIQEVLHRSAKPTGIASVVKNGEVVTSTNLNEVVQNMQDYTKHTVDSSKVDMDRLERMSRESYYPVELFNFEEAVLTAIEKEATDELLKPFDSLTPEQQAKVIALVLPYVYGPTFIHEVGHNLGLRHNFSGSEDKPNYYASDELKAMGIGYDIHSSSVMDYPYKEIGELEVLGKYDVAALRFGYARKVETKDGQFLPVKTTLTELKTDKAISAKLKDFKYCTDEHVSANPGCNRFDTGTNLVEIAQHMVDSYEKWYELHNTRSNRRSFTMYNDGSYAEQLQSRLQIMRMFFERYESILAYGDEEIFKDPSLPFLQDLEKATAIIGVHLLKVIAEPDVHCAVARKDKPNMVIGLLPLAKQANGDLYSCDKLSLNDAYISVGQGGKHFQHRKEPGNPNHYVDQIDTRGIWADKLSALDTLLMRKVDNPANDRQMMNFMQISFMFPRLMETFHNILLDDLEGEILIKTPSGQELPIKEKYQLTEFPYDSRSGKTQSATHVVKSSLSGYANRIFDLPENSDQLFIDKILSKIKSYIPNDEYYEVSSLLMSYFSVKRGLTSEEIKNGKFLEVQSGNSTYWAPENSLAHEIRDLKQVLPLGKLTYSAIKKVRDLMVPQAQLQKKIADLEAKSGQKLGKTHPLVFELDNLTEQIIKQLTPDEKAVYDLGLKKIETFGKRQIKSEGYYNRLLDLLARR